MQAAPHRGWPRCYMVLIRAHTKGQPGPRPQLAQLQEEGSGPIGAPWVTRDQPTSLRVQQLGPKIHGRSRITRTQHQLLCGFNNKHLTPIGAATSIGLAPRSAASSARTHLQLAWPQQRWPSTIGCGLNSRRSAKRRGFRSMGPIPICTASRVWPSPNRNRRGNMGLAPISVRALARATASPTIWAMPLLL